ncbi:MAG: cellulase family glycosylhydrolase [Rhodopirellula sp.]|nr:cellulase family glycosylhydrolase [Rhodopirellula sp.]
MKHSILATVLTALAFGQAAGGQPQSLPQASPEHLPRWRGFNLLEKFQRDRNGPFQEEDFRLIHELGFNFVRLPMDYRCWIRDNDWTQFNEPSLREIDEAVGWGGKYGIHVLINFHRAPGYTVARPAESKSLWTDPEAQRVCAMHWAAFARRYRGIANERLSFNLFNEPAHVEPEVYLEVVKKIAAAIRAEDPDRLIISDGLQWGRFPIPELAELKIAQATRGYTPMDITHYRASWVSGADQYPVPAWPRPQANGTLYAPHKGGMKPESLQPLVIEGPLETETVLRLHVMTVSSQATLVARADGKDIWEKHFPCGPGDGEWKQSEFQPQWKIYRAAYDRDYEVPVPAGTKRIEIAVTGGDWLTLTEIGLKRAGAEEDVLTLRADWDEPPATVRYMPAAESGRFVSGTMENRQWLWETAIIPWKEAREKGIGVMVGEFGCHNRTPHDVVLAWMEDCLANWREAGFGWALWNFRGSFGVLDSGRADVEYEDFHGHQLDRKMLDLLQNY